MGSMLFGITIIFCCLQSSLTKIFKKHHGGKDGKTAAPIGKDGKTYYGKGKYTTTGKDGKINYHYQPIEVEGKTAPIGKDGKGKTAPIGKDGKGKTAPIGKDRKTAAPIGKDGKNYYGNGKYYF